MVVSLYIYQIPENVLEEDLENIFSELEGYIETRLKKTTAKGKIAFIDFETEVNAKYAMNLLQNFKFTEKVIYNIII